VIAETAVRFTGAVVEGSVLGATIGVGELRATEDVGVDVGPACGSLTHATNSAAASARSASHLEG
jgi:hypothetical protein